MASVILGGLLMGAPESWACSLRPEGIQLDTSDLLEVPANGALLLRTRCSKDCDDGDTQLEFRLVSRTLEPVEGSIIHSTVKAGSGWLAWQPERPLVAGEVYGLWVHGEHFSPPIVWESSVVVVADVPEIDASAFVPTLVGKGARIVLDGETHCCEPSRPSSCRGPVCSLLATSASTRVSLKFEVPGEAAELSRFAFAIRVPGTDQVEPEWQESSALHSEFEKAEEYCYEILALHVASGEQSLLGGGCVSNEGIEFPSESEAIEAKNSQVFTGCSVPPEGQEALWCLNISQGPGADFCQNSIGDRSRCEAALAACGLGDDSAEPVQMGGAGPAVDDDSRTTAVEETDATPGGGGVPGGPVEEGPAFDGDSPVTTVEEADGTAGVGGLPGDPGGCRVVPARQDTRRRAPAGLALAWAALALVFTRRRRTS